MANQATHPAGAFPEREAAVRERRTTDLRGALLGGAVAGMIAGAVMAMMAMFRAWAVGMGFWFPPKQIAAVLFGVDALVGDAGVITVGLIIHMMMSAGFGALFGVIGGARVSVGAAFGLGLLYGVLVWAVMTYIGLPLVNEVMRERVAMQPVWWFVYHLIFGGVLLLTPPLARALGGRKHHHRPAGA